MVRRRPSSSPRMSESRVKRERPWMPTTSGTRLVSENQYRSRSKSPRVKGPEILIVDGGTAVLTQILLMDSLGPALALPAYFDVSIRGRKRDLSTPSVDGASN